MDIQDVFDLIQRFGGSSLEELDMTLGGDSIRLKKTGKKDLVQLTEDAPSMIPEGTKDKMTARELKAPLAGVFYRAPSPDAEVFVKPGQRIRKGDVVGIIEAMKLMNEVTAAEDGVIDEILVKDGELVAYDEVLIRYV